MKKVYLYSNGCIETLLDVSIFREFFRRNNWIIVGDYLKADLILFSTCAARKVEEEFAVKKILEFQRRKKSASDLVVCGCLPKINEKRLKGIFSGYYFDVNSNERLNELINARVRIQDIRSHILEKDDFSEYNFRRKLFVRISEALPKLGNLLGKSSLSILKRIFYFFDACNSEMFYIKISTGCLGECSYCAVRFAKGSVKSKSIGTIIDEFKTGVEAGYRNFVLSADDAGAYGRDIDTDLISLLEKVLEIGGNYKICIRFIEAKWLIKMFSGLKGVLKSGKISSFCSPVQSGNNRILKLMNKDYSIEDYKRCIRELNGEFPSLMIGTCIIVGFPTETEDEFRDSLHLLDEVRFHSVGVSEYSDRPGTGSSKMNGQIPHWVRRQRFHRLCGKALFNRLKNWKY